MAEKSEQMRVAVKWNGKLLDIAVPVVPPPTVASLKHAISETTKVSAKRQRLLGFSKPANPGDSVELSSLTIPASGLMLVGTPDTVLEAEAARAAEAPEVVDDLLDLPEGVAYTLENDPAVLAKLDRRVAAAKHVLVNAPREGKKLLVLDIDYTIFDLNSSAERPEELARPGLHAFLQAAYEHYDIVIWSATGMKWVNVKMTELGVLNNPAYKVTALMDHMSMLTVGPLPGYGVFDCKPLAYLWRTWPEHYNARNTIMFDDLRRNFVLNPQCGLKIKPYRNAHTTRHTDDELLHLTRYLLRIAQLDDLSGLNHDKWKRFLEKSADGKRTIGHP
jgi:ubiquitin-like domain-containing CTD phosphatase 1